MKKSILALIAPAFLLLSLNSYAADTETTTTTTKTTISGEPVVVTKSGNTYTLPGTTTYTTKSDYYYITTDGNKQVCYREVQSTFAGVSPVDLSLKIGNDLISVHCYAYSADYFTVQ